MSLIELFVRWKDENVWNGDQKGFEQQFASFNAQAGCVVVEERTYSDHDLTQTLEFDPIKYSVLDQLLLYQANEMVDYVQPDYIYDAQTVPNDPIYASQQWSLPKISAPSAWSLTTGSDSVIVGILDTGANVANTNGHIAHPDFTSNLWSGQNNGDAHNFSATPYSTDVYTSTDHGSNVASIVGAQGNNGIYMSGLCWNVSLLHLKVLTEAGSGPSTGIAAGIDYARTHGASAINLSLGYFLPYCYIDPETHKEVCDGYILDQVLFDALRRARDSGVVAVCSAGNSYANNDTYTFSPANSPTDNVIAVAASDQNDAWTFSDYGARTVDLAAPGVSIYGLKPSYNGNSSDLTNYSVITGTSQAAPHVTGTIALLKAKYGWETYYGLRDRVLMGTDALTASSWVGHPLRTNGRLNANKALHARTLIRNLSTRARVENGDRVMIGGFIIGGSGTGTLKVAIRGLGPSLDPYINVAALPNPKLTLKNSSGTTITSNDDWVNMPSLQKTDFISAGLDKYNGTGISSVESGIVWTLGPGSYSVFMESNNGTSFGVGLFDLYELEGGVDEQTRLLNVSTRCLVRTGDEQAIAGVIVGDPTQGGNTAIPKRSILMFGKGPSLGISGYLANPYLTLKNSAGTTIGTNDSWSILAAPTDELTEAGLSPTSTVESALWPILNSGTYTTSLSGVSSGTGVGLIEMYEY